MQQAGFVLKLSTLLIIAVLVLGVFVVYNQLQLGRLARLAGPSKVGAATSLVDHEAHHRTQQTQSAAQPTTQLAALITPKGTPERYGPELGVSYDEPLAGLSVLSRLDPSTPNGVRLGAEQLRRYIDIGSRISCEFCCGAKTLVFPDGRPACGCEHSFAMRGLLAYLITEHPDLSDEMMLRELARWKTLFFPGPMTTKFASQLAAGGPSTDDTIALSSGLDLSGVDPGAITGGQPSMVGGC